MSLPDLQHRAFQEAQARYDHGGIHRHSHADSYFIFCVGTDPAKIEAFMEWAFENDMGFKALRGCYKGISEHSFIANLKNFEQIIPFLQSEETVLILDQYDARDRPKARLQHIKTGERTELGRFLPVEEERAKLYDSWTYDPVTDTYFICERGH